MGVAAAKNGADRRQLNLADARQVVHHLLLLVAELFFIRQALPFATATHAEVLAERRGALLGIAMELDDFCLGIAVLLAPHLQIHHVAGHGIRHKDDEVVNLGNGFSFGSHAGDGDIL